MKPDPRTLPCEGGCGRTVTVRDHEAAYWCPGCWDDEKDRLRVDDEDEA